MPVTRAERLTRWLLAAGALLRVAQYLANRSLWLDEAYIAPTILRRSFAELLWPPDYGQIVPVGFLALERAAVGLFGSSEYALRLVPLVAGIGSLFLFARVARRLLPAPALPIAMALVSFSGPLIGFSSELKQYSCDVLAALFLLDRALDVSERPAGPQRRGALVTLAISGAVLVWFSLPAVFVLAGVGATLAVGAVRSGERQRLRAVAATGLLWIGSFAAFWIVFLRHIGRAPDVLAFWADAFLPFPPRSFADVYWLPRTFGALFGDPAGFVFRGLGILAFLVGGVVLFRESRERLAFLIAPALFALAASVLRWYPFSGRTLLFLAPALYLLVSFGIEEIRETTSPRAPAVWAILLALLLFHPVLWSVRALFHPREKEEMKPALAYVRGHADPGDRLYVYSAALPAFGYYGPRSGFPADRTIPGAWVGETAGAKRDVDKIRGGRVWVLFTHPIRPDGANDEARFTSLLDAAGRRLDSFFAAGASVYLYDVTSTPAGPS
ncbi:MAG TPA: hypothetical protein VIA45_15015 [Thermoanaerobaculia bacterium]|jgi:hypothetical protein